jgi:hypothetical protein
MQSATRRFAVRIADKNYQVDEEGLGDLRNLHEAAGRMVVEILAPSLRDHITPGRERSEAAYAMIMYAYELIRGMKNTEKADLAFNVFAHFAKANVEEGRRALLAKKLN